MSKYRVGIEHIPTIQTQRISRGEMQDRLFTARRWDRVKLDDHYYFYPSWEDWDKVFLHLMRNLPKYVPDRFDCDNFADYLRIKCAEIFGINTCARVDGYADVGRGVMECHAWSVFFDGESFYQLESQKRGLLMDLDDPAYSPREIIMG